MKSTKPVAADTPLALDEVEPIAKILRRFDSAGMSLGALSPEAHQALAAAMNVPGLPVTVILDRDGAEIGRLMGGADWNTPNARAIVTFLTGLD